ncbi:hypothetical protein MIND_00257100 [Mycena indigotica]|uniref:DUF6534 domain-containing protein n=1 Tax=Mycena indigotica TaxID=2126181 RepID=A0A8H6WDF2_9AGAR|nr:uncharacterized protein MIND_00257100 [Mycena indigotica]KAF7312436.1 hypothetical protein MIND_00257100 [Mycena indigotica]
MSASMSVPTALGSLLLGGLFASLLSGVVATDVVAYFRVYKADAPGLKALILAIGALDLFHTGLIWTAMWEYAIANWGLTSRIDYIPWSIALTVLITAIVTFLVHCFFAQRIFRLSKRNWYMAASVVFFALVRLAAASVSTAEMLRYKSFPVYMVHSRWILTFGLSMSSCVDILITALLLYLFKGSRRPKGSHLNQVLDQMSLYAFETGSLTCLGTIATMICWITMHHNLVFLGLHFAIGKLYAISLLVTLNTREGIRRSRATMLAERGGVLVLPAEIPSDKNSSSGHGTY